MRGHAPEHRPDGGGAGAVGLYAWLDRLALWPVVAVSLLIVALLFTDGSVSYEHPSLLLGFNVFCTTLVSLFIAVLVARRYLEDGSRGLLLFGCGALFWSFSGVVGVVAGLWPLGGSGFNSNTLVTIHNICAWLSALCHLSGVALACRWHERTTRSSLWMPSAYFGVVFIVGLVVLATLTDRTPLFFQPGLGGTLTRQLVLGSAIAMFALAALLLRSLHDATKSDFARWYGLAIVLLAVGLTGVLLQEVTGSALSWAGRAAQYLGGLYMLVAALGSTRGPHLTRVDLEQIVDRTGQLILVAAVAVVSTATAAAVRLFVFQDLGTSLSYITFFPAVMLAAFMGGLGAGILTVLLSLVVVFLFWTEPVGTFTAIPLPDLLEALLFTAGGVLVALLARAADRAQSNLLRVRAEAEKARELARQAEAVRVSEERLANVIEATEAGIWDWRVQSGELVCNERWAEIVGFTLAELSPLSIATWQGLAHPDDLGVSDSQLQEVFARTRTLYECECRMKHRDGGWVWVLDRGKVVEWSDDGRPVRMTGSHTDITVRKQAEAQLAGLMREMRVILETVPVGIAKIVDRRVVWINSALEQMLHYTKGELLHQATSVMYLRHEDFQDLGEAAYPLLAEGGVYSTELHLKRKDNSRVLARCTGRAIAPADPGQGAIWTVEDVTERTLAEEAIRDRAELFHALFECNQMVNLLIDPRDGALLDGNDAAVVFYGQPRERLLALHIGDLGIGQPAETEAMMARAREGWRQPHEDRHRQASGELRDVHVFFSPIVIGGRTVLHAMIQDVTERRRLDAALRESRALLHGVTEGTSDAVYIKDWAGRYLMCNTATARYLGESPEAILGRDDRAFFSADEAHQIMEGDRAVLEGGVLQTYEEHVTLGGEVVTFLSTKGPVRNAAGAIIGLFGIARDITERKRMEQMLAEREHNLRNLVETTSDLIVVATSRGEILFTNERFRTTLGYDSDDLAAMHLLALHPPALRREAERIFADLLADLRETCPLPILTKDGALVPVETRARKGTWNGEPCLYGFIKDLSAEQEARQRFERLFRFNPAPMVLSSLPDRTIVDVNKAFTVASGYQRDETIGRTSRQLGFFGEQIEAVEELVRHAVRFGFFQPTEMQVTNREGQVLDGLLSGEVIRSQGHDYLLAVMVDITERKRMERELLQSKEAALAANEMKSKLLATVAHEFRTPLSLLQSSLDILDRYGERLSEAQRSERHIYIRRATRQLADLADTVLTYRMMEEGGGTERTIPCDIGRLCRTIAEETGGAWATGHALTVKVAPDCGVLLLDEQLFRRVLENLLANAFQYTPPEKGVFLEVARRDNLLRVVVADQGIGVAEEELAHIFDSFYRGGNVGQRRGMGLGLSIVRDALLRMGGSITVTSTLGKGTTFELTLPWREAAA